MQGAASHTTQPDALDALRAEVRNGGYQVPVACAECGAGEDDRLVLIDRYAESRRDQGGITNPSGDVAVSIDGDEADLTECPSCLEEVRPDLVVLRDRHGRCAAALDERRRRGLDLRAALNHGKHRRAYAILRRAA